VRPATYLDQGFL